MNDEAVVRAKPSCFKLLAGPAFFTVFGVFGCVFASLSIDPAPPGQLGAAFWPKMCMSAIVIAAIVRGIEIVRRSGQTDESCECKQMDNRKLALMIGLIVLVVPLISVIGFPLACFVFFWLFMQLAGLKKVLNLFLISFLGTIGMIFTFVKIVYLPLPKGFGFFEDLTLLIYRALFII